MADMKVTKIIENGSHKSHLLAHLLALAAIAALPGTRSHSAEAAEAQAGTTQPSPARVAPGQTFNVLDYGATGDGKASNTDAFRKAIEACAAAGGGRVHLPPGTYITGPIELK